MLKKTLTYENFDGVTVSEEFYFNITKTDLTKMEVGKLTLDQATQGVTGGMEAYVGGIMSRGKGQEIMDLFELFIEKSYGVKSADGRRHVKSPELYAEFQATAAYDALFTELVTNADAGAEFFNGIMPKDLRGELEEKVRPVDTFKPAVATRQELGFQDLPDKFEAVELGSGAKSVGLAQNKNQSKAVIVAKMKIKQGKAVYIDDELMDALTADELNQAMENGSRLV